MASFKPPYGGDKKMDKEILITLIAGGLLTLMLTYFVLMLVKTGEKS